MNGPQPEHASSPDDVVSCYETGIESERLDRGRGALEFARTKELIARYLKPGSTLADVGAGTGVTPTGW